MFTAVDKQVAPWTCMQARGFILTGWFETLCVVSEAGRAHIKAVHWPFRCHWWIPCLFWGWVPTCALTDINLSSPACAVPVLQYTGEKQLPHWHSCWRLEAHLLSTWCMWPSINNGGKRKQQSLPYPRTSGLFLCLCIYLRAYLSLFRSLLLLFRCQNIAGKLF